MLKKFWILVFASLFVFACTKEEKKQAAAPKVDLVAYKSKIPYLYKKARNDQAAALLQGAEVPWSQLLTGDVALQELQQRFDEQASAFAYAWAQGMAGDASSTLNIYTEKPKSEITDILKKKNIDKTAELTLQYEFQPTSQRLASFNGKDLNWADFNSANMAHSRMYEKLFLQRMQRLNGIVIRRLLLQAAQAENIAMEAYVQKHIIAFMHFENYNKIEELQGFSV